MLPVSDRKKLTRLMNQASLEDAPAASASAGSGSSVAESPAYPECNGHLFNQPELHPRRPRRCQVVCPICNERPCGKEDKPESVLGHSDDECQLRRENLIMLEGMKLQHELHEIERRRSQP